MLYRMAKGDLNEVATGMPPPHLSGEAKACNVWAIMFTSDGRNVAALFASDGTMSVLEDGRPFGVISFDGVSYPSDPGGSQGKTIG
jgi:hypothetical protein